MKLYYAPGACSRAAHIVLRELDLPFELVKVDLKTHTLEDGRDYYEVSPNGYVPALELDDGTVLTENIAILEYLGDRKPDLLPAPGSMARYRTVEKLAFVSTEIHKSYGPLFNPNMPEDAKKQAVDKLASRFDHLDRELADRPYLAGDAFTVPDAYAFTVLGWTRMFDIDLDRWRNVKAFVRRVRERPAVAKALEVEKAAA